jgi:hypothetical protein
MRRSRSRVAEDVAAVGEHERVLVADELRADRELGQQRLRAGVEQERRHAAGGGVHGACAGNTCGRGDGVAAVRELPLRFDGWSD